MTDSLPTTHESLALDAEFLPTIVNHLPDGVLACLAVRNERGAITDFEIVFANPAAIDLTHNAPTALVGKRLLAAFPQMKRDGLFERFVDVVTTGAPFAAERFFTQTRKWLRIVVGAFHDGVTATISAIADESNFRAFEELHKRYGAEHASEAASLAAFRQLRKRFDAIFNNTFQFTYLISTDGAILEINQTALSFAGVEANKVIGYPFSAMRWLGDGDTARKQLEAALYRASGGEFVRYATEFWNFEGKPVAVDFSLKPMFNEFGDIDFFVAEGRDISAIKQMELERDRERELADSLHKLNELKSEFVSSVSHELRTPLASIMGFAQTLLRDPNLPIATAQKFLNIILEDGQRLSRLVEDLLDLSRIESGRIQLALAPVNVAEIVEYAVHLTGAGASAKSITLEFVAPAQPALVSADRDRLTQVVVNLLDNAVKFTPERGSVTAQIAVFEHYAVGELVLRRAVCLSITDTGIGIAEHEVPHLFEKFYRVNQPGKEIRGTGLGLAIAKQIAELHGGSIFVQSAAGKGSTFTVVLPG